MKWLIILLICITLFITCNQEKTEQEKPLTEIEKLLKGGVFIDKNSYKMGSVDFKMNKVLEFNIVEIRELETNVNIISLALNLKPVNDISKNIVTGYLDYQNLLSLLNALETIIVRSEELKEKQIEYKEIFFRTDNDIRLGFFHMEKNQVGFIKLNNWQSDASVFFKINKLSKIYDLLMHSKNEIDSMKGGIK